MRLEPRLPIRRAAELEAGLAMLAPAGAEQALARDKLLEAIRQAKRNCPSCMTVLEPTAGSLGLEPGRLGGCASIRPACPEGRPYIHNLTGVCTSVAEIKALQ